MVELLTMHNKLEGLSEHATLTDQDQVNNCITRDVWKLDAAKAEYYNLPIFQRHAATENQGEYRKSKLCKEWNSDKGCAQSEICRACGLAV